MGQSHSSDATIRTHDPNDISPSSSSSPPPREQQHDSANGDARLSSSLTTGTNNSVTSASNILLEQQRHLEGNGSTTSMSTTTTTTTAAAAALGNGLMSQMTSIASPPPLDADGNGIINNNGSNYHAASHVLPNNGIQQHHLPTTTTSNPLISISFATKQPLVSIPLNPVITLKQPYPVLFRWVRLVPKAARQSHQENVAKEEAQQHHGENSSKRNLHLQQQQQHDSRDTNNGRRKRKSHSHSTTTTTTKRTSNHTHYQEYVVSHSATYTPTPEDQNYQLRFQCIVIRDARGVGMQVAFKEVMPLPNAMRPKRTWRDQAFIAAGNTDSKHSSANHKLSTTSITSSSSSKRISSTKIDLHQRFSSSRSSDLQWKNSSIDKSFVLATYQMMGQYWPLLESELNAALSQSQQNTSSTLSPSSSPLPFASASSNAKKLERQKQKRLRQSIIEQHQIMKQLKRAYPRCPSYAFLQAYRKKMVLRELLSYHSDLYCLQGVNLEEYKFWNIELSKLGYSSFVLDHPSEEPTLRSSHVGICMLFRRSKFNKIDQHVVKFSELTRLKAYDEAWSEIIPRVKNFCYQHKINFSSLNFGGRSAMIQEFDLRDLYLMRTNLDNDKDEKLLVANVELFVPANKPKDYRDAIQCIQLFTVLHHLHYIWREKYRCRKNIGLILACDLGSDASSDAYKYVTENLMEQQPSTTEHSNSQQENSDTIPADDSSTSSHEYTMAIRVTEPLGDESGEDSAEGHHRRHVFSSPAQEDEESVPRISIGDSTPGSPDNYRVQVSPHHRQNIQDYSHALDSMDTSFEPLDAFTPPRHRHHKRKRNTSPVGRGRSKSNNNHASSPKHSSPLKSFNQDSVERYESIVAPGLESPFLTGFQSAYASVLGKEPSFIQSDASKSLVPTTSFIFTHNLGTRRVSEPPQDVTLPNQWAISNRSCIMSDLEFVEDSGDGEKKVVPLNKGDDGGQV